MKLFAVSAVLGLIVSLAGTTLAHDDKTDRKSHEKIEKSTPVDPMATVTLCVMSGSLTVRGWEKNEIRVRSTDDVQLDFRRIDKTKDVSKPATRVDVMVVSLGLKTRADCQALADVEMDVPAGATVQVQTRDGDITITGVAAAYAGSQNGDIVITRATRLVEAGSVGGSIVLKDSSGRVNLSSAGGGVDVSNLKASSDDDVVEVGTVSGDIQLTRVSTQKVIAKTVNGTVMMNGPLVKAGSYNFTSMGGNLILAMPSDSSFQLNAKLSEKKDLVSDFALKYVGDVPPAPMPKPDPVEAPTPPPAKAPKPPPAKGGLAKTGPIVAPLTVVKPTIVVSYILHRINAIYGSGDATISVASFGGTLRLKKLSAPSASPR
jgi:hypothetical protein